MLVLCCHSVPSRSGRAIRLWGCHHQHAIASLRSLDTIVTSCPPFLEQVSWQAWMRLRRVWRWARAARATSPSCRGSLPSPTWAGYPLRPTRNPGELALHRLRLKSGTNYPNLLYPKFCSTQMCLTYLKATRSSSWKRRSLASYWFEWDETFWSLCILLEQRTIVPRKNRLN